MKGIAAYNRTRVQSAPNELILVMLLERVLDELAAARRAREAVDNALWNASLHRSRAIFIELLSALDTAENPALTVPLSQTWAWCTMQLAKIARSRDLDTITRVEEVTRMMLDTWTQALDLRDQELAAS